MNNKQPFRKLFKVGNKKNKKIDKNNKMDNNENKNGKIKKFEKATHLKWFAGIVFVVILLLVIRIFYLQFIIGNELKEKAYKQITANRVLSPKRGTIYDTTGKALAVSTNVDTISVNPSLIIVKGDQDATNALKQKVAKALADCLELNYDDVLVKVTSTNSVEIIAKKVDSDKVDALKKWMSDNKFTSGINIDEDTKRTYPYNNLASNLIGFCGSDNNGLSGLEYYWDSTLTGTPGRVTTAINAAQDSIPDEDEKYIAAENGSNITLSIDANIQTIVEKYLKQAVEENNCKNGGSMVLMDPSTGDILAMATYPDYNLNTPFEPNESMLATWDTLTSEEKTNSLYKMYSNKVVNETFEPGSVFKPIIASIGLEENVVETDTAGDFYCSGKQQVADINISCANTSGHGSQSLRNALENSCNPALIQLGNRIGATTMYKYFSAFGLFDKTGIQTSGESSSQFHKLDSVGPTELATMSFGQRFTITPLQMITAASAIANDGKLVKPRIVTKIENPDTGVVTNIDVQEVRQVISSETAAKVRDMMQSVVTDGGGQLGAVKGYSIAGKTGTSEPDPNHPENGYVASFLAIAPVENAKVVALLSLYGPQGKSHYGGQISAPVVSQVLSEVLPYLGIPSNDTSSESTSSYTVTIPDLKGKTVTEAKNILSDLGIQIITSADGDETIINQTPKAGVSLAKGGIVKVYTENANTSVSVSVPDLKGKSLSAAKSALKSKNLNIQATGSGVVVSQDVQVGTSVEEGTVIKVNLQETTSELH